MEKRTIQDIQHLYNITVEYEITEKKICEIERAKKQYDGGWMSLEYGDSVLYRDGQVGMIPDNMPMALKTKIIDVVLDYYKEKLVGLASSLRDDGVSTERAEVAVTGWESSLSNRSWGYVYAPNNPGNISCHKENVVRRNEEDTNSVKPCPSHGTVATGNTTCVSLNSNPQGSLIIGKNADNIYWDAIKDMAAKQ